jgi:hypothetical protein
MECVNGLWVGGPLSTMERLSILSILAQGYSYRLWAYAPLAGLPPGVEMADAAEIIPRADVFSYDRFENRAKCSYQGFSDLFRYKLLYERGGWWVDLDATLLRALPDVPYAMACHHRIGLVGNVLHFPKGHPVLRDAYEQTRLGVTSANTSWLKPIRILMRAIDRHLGRKEVVAANLGGDTLAATWGLAGLPGGAVPPDWHGVHWCRTRWTKLKLDPDRPREGSAYDALVRRFGASNGAAIPKVAEATPELTPPPPTPAA